MSPDAPEWWAPHVWEASYEAIGREFVSNRNTTFVFGALFYFVLLNLVKSIT